MKPRRNNKASVAEETEMEPVEVFARIKTVSEQNKEVNKIY